MGVWNTGEVDSPRVGPLRKVPGNFHITSALNVNHFLNNCTNSTNHWTSLFSSPATCILEPKKKKKASSAAKTLVDLLKQCMRNNISDVVCHTIPMTLKTAIFFLNDRLRGCLLGYHTAISQLLGFITPFPPQKIFLTWKDLSYFKFFSLPQFFITLFVGLVFPLSGRKQHHNESTM